MDVDEAFSLIAHAVDTGTNAGGYLIVGAVRGNAAELADRIIGKLFPNAAGQVAAHAHPDVIFLEPQGKSRTIKVARGPDDDGPGMRDGLLEPMSETAYAGGWKVGVIVSADRMQVAAANAFLKSLEEPTPRTLYLLLTDAPDAILPTIVSRCQRIDLKLPTGELEGDSRAAVAEIMTANVGNGVFAKAQVGHRLAAILGELKDAADDADVAMVRRAFYKTLMAFAREWMVDGRIPRHQAFRNLEAIEAAARQSERALPDDSVLTFLTDRMIFPPQRTGI